MIGEITNLHWLRPQWLLMFLPVILLLALHWRRAGKRSGWEAIIDPQLLEPLLDGAARSTVENSNANHRLASWRRRIVSRHLALLATALALCIAIVAMAGPAWERVPQPPQRTDDSMIIIVDLSLSMYAKDVSPSRLTRMRFKLLELLSRRAEGQTALIAYSGDAHVVSPLTDDAETIAAMVPSLSPEIMPSIGSDAASAFQLAASLPEAGAALRVVWFTDDLAAGDRAGLNALLRQHRVELFIVGIGSTSGSPIPLPSGKFLKDQRGMIANAQLPAARLADLARQSGGRYLAMTVDNSDIDTIGYARQELALQSAAAQSDAISFDVWRDRGGSLCLLLLPFSLLIFRRGWLLGLSSSTAPCTLPGLAAPLGAAIALTLLSLGHSELAVAQATADEPADKTVAESPFDIDLWRNRDQRALQLLQSGEAQRAANLFEREDWRGVAAFQAGDYSEASDAFKRQLETLTRDATQARAAAHYNLGHALAKQGQLQSAIAAYDEALAAKPDYSDAKKARDIVAALLQQQQDDAEQGGEQQDGGQQSGEQQNSGQQQGQQSSQNADQQNGQQAGDNASNNAADSEAEQSATDQASEPQNSTEPERASRDADYAGAAEQAKQKQAAAAPSASDDQPAEKAETTVAKTAEQGVASGSTSHANSDKPSDAQANAPQLSAEEMQQQAQLQQWLNKIEDDPGGLLRRKFQHQRQLRERSGNVVAPDEDGKIW